MKKISRRSFLAAATALALARSGSSEATSADLNFLVVGDWGTGSSDQHKVATQMAKTAEAIGARFVISAGDNFYPDGVANLDDPQWTAKFEDAYGASTLRVPWYVVLGNHDHKGNVEAQVDYTADSSRWQMPANYYKHSEALADGSRADFFFIDTDPIKRRYRSIAQYFSGDAQVDWLERELAASKAIWKVVIGHHPVFSGGTHKNTDALIVWLEPLLKRHGVQVYLNGHNHNLEHVVVGKTHYLTSGAGSLPRAATVIDGTQFVVGERLGFMTASLTPAAMNIEFIDEHGICLYRASIPVRPAKTELP